MNTHILSTFHSSCPVAARTTETFVEYTSIAGERRRFEFTKPIIWLQESEAQVQFLHGGKLLKEGSTHSDYYGYLTSFRNPNTEGIAAHYGITLESSLELVIVATVFRTPAIETDETRAHNLTRPPRRKPMYAQVPQSWCKEIDSEFTPDGKAYPPLDRVDQGKGVVWSSKNDPEQNRVLAEQFLQQWAVPV